MEIVDKSTQTTESILTPTHFPLNMFIVLHALRPPVRPRCSKPPIYFVSLLNQQISLFLHSMFSLRGTSQTAKADHICDPVACTSPRNSLSTCLCSDAPPFGLLPLCEGHIVRTSLCFLEALCLNCSFVAILARGKCNQPLTMLLTVGDWRTELHAFSVRLFDDWAV